MNTRSFSCFFIILYFRFIGLIHAHKLHYDEFLDHAYIELPSSSIETINVLSCGAKGDGATDDSKAFLECWKEACSSTQQVNFLVPGSKSYLLKPVTFSGPCKSQITVEILGEIIASENSADYVSNPTIWLLFHGVSNLVVQGGGTIDGRGSTWWINSCKVNKSKKCQNFPTALTFESCNNLDVTNLKIINSQQIHLTFSTCTNVVASSLTVTAPETSPNTDGVHISGSRNVTISSTNIATGDDCISIVTGSTTIHATNITCGPGHGISIGSLGEKDSIALVQDVLVDGATIIGTEAGVRIKTWEGGSGHCSDITFRNIKVKNVKNPIIIDQEYCDPAVQSCSKSQGAVIIENVLYKNISGTSATKDAITFECTESISCTGIQLENINLVDENGGKSSATCLNVKPQISGLVSPTCPSALSWSMFEAWII